MRAWVMARQTQFFALGVALVLSGWTLWLLIDENFYGHAATLAGAGVLMTLFVWNGEEDPERNRPLGTWMNDGGGQ